MKARKTDEKPKNKNAQPEYLQKIFGQWPSRAGEIPQCAEESPVRCAARTPAVPTTNRESATAVRARKPNGNKKLLPGAPKLSRRAARISGVPVNDKNASKQQEPDMIEPCVFRGTRPPVGDQ